MGSVRLVEVGPRDGLQNETQIFSLEDKTAFISKLMVTGLKNIEVTSFVSPKAIPQMADAKQIFTQIKNQFQDPALHLIGLVPNERGLKDALEVGLTDMAIFTATSDAFNQKNINTDLAGWMTRIKPVIQQANKYRLKTRAYISTVFGCPYEGEQKFEKTLLLTEDLFKLGAQEVVLSDTIGVATPSMVRKLLKLLRGKFDFSKLALHFHDTRGMAVTNVLSAYELGIEKFDSAAGGLGGCPYAKGASGNVATEDLCYLFDSLGVETGVNFDLLAEASQFILNKLGRPTSSKVLQAYLSRKN